jgi:hypothetical protein
MAMELGRSIPGFMAGDMVRVHRYLRSRVDVDGILLAMASDSLDVALVHSALSSPADAPDRIVLVAPRSSLGRAATERIYVTKSYYSWIFGLLKHYDLSDTVAAMVDTTKLLVLGPVDGASLVPLNATAAQEAYAFATRSASSGSITVTAGTFSQAAATAMALDWAR